MTTSLFILLCLLLLNRSNAHPIPKRQETTSLSPMLIVLADWNRPINTDDIVAVTVSNSGQSEETGSATQSATQGSESETVSTQTGGNEVDSTTPTTETQAEEPTTGTQGEETSSEIAAAGQTAIAEGTAVTVDTTRKEQSDPNDADGSSPNQSDDAVNDSDKSQDNSNESNNDLGSNSGDEEDSSITIQPTQTDSIGLSSFTSTDAQGNTITAQAAIPGIAADGEDTPEEAAFRSKANDLVDGANIQVTQEGDDDSTLSGLSGFGNSGNDTESDSSFWPDLIYDGPDLANANWPQIALPDPNDPKTAGMANLIKENRQKLQIGAGVTGGLIGLVILFLFWRRCMKHRKPSNKSRSQTGRRSGNRRDSRDHDNIENEKESASPLDNSKWPPLPPRPGRRDRPGSDASSVADARKPKRSFRRDAGRAVLNELKPLARERLKRSLDKRTDRGVRPSRRAAVAVGAIGVARNVRNARRNATATSGKKSGLLGRGLRRAVLGRR